jgi:aminoglycoside phosphotransferase (APT) family kinase protein
MAYPPAEAEITARLASELIAAQFPEWAGRVIGERFEGWDNITFRLGGDLAVRMPRLAVAAELAVVEHTWLPRLSGAWGFSAPVPLAVGDADLGYPWAWSVVPWIDGIVAAHAPLDAMGRADLGHALSDVHVPSPSDAPVCPWRATSLAARRPDFLETLGSKALDSIDRARALEIYDAGADLTPPAPVWTHLDVHGLNVVTREGRLAGILDWGEMSGSDFAADLGQAWVLVGEAGFADVLAGYDRALGTEDEVRVAAHAIDAATRLAQSSAPGHTETAARALAELGVGVAPQ